MDESIATGNFTIRTGLDTELDAKKEQFLKARDELQALIGDDLKQFPQQINEATCHFVAEMGFLIGN